MDSSYNPYYDNSMEGNRRSHFLASSGKRVLQEQKEQILMKEEKQKLERAQQIEYERRIQNQEPVPVYLQRDDRTQVLNASQRREIIRNMDSEANKNAGGGFFAKVFKQRDVKDQQKQQQKQAYVDEIQRQIEENKRKKEEEKQRRIDEDKKYEEKIKQEREKMNERQSKEEEKKQVIKTIKNKHLIQQQDESKMMFNEFEEQQTNLTNNNIVPNYLKENLKEVDDKFEQDFKNKTNPHTPITKLQSQRTLQDQNTINIIFNQPRTAGNYQSQHSNSQHQQQLQFQMDQQQQQYQQYQQQFNQQQQQQYYQDQYQQQQNLQYQQFEYRPIVPQLMERFQRELEEIKMVNKMKNREQEEGIDKLREQIEMQSQLWNDDVRRLRADVQMSVEQKNRAYYELENLKDQLKRQELFEEAQLSSVKQHIGLRQPDNFQERQRKLVSQAEYQSRSGSRQIQPQFEENLNGYENSFEQQS